MTDLTWQNMDVEALPADLRDLYTDYRAAGKVASAKRATFEEAMTERAKAKTPPGKTLVFGYKFGKLSWAFGDAKLAAPKAKPIASIFA